MKKKDDKKEVAILLGKSPRTLENWRHQRIGPQCFWISNKVMYLSVDVDAWISKQKYQSRHCSMI